MENQDITIETLNKLKQAKWEKKFINRTDIIYETFFLYPKSVDPFSEKEISLSPG